MSDAAEQLELVLASHRQKTGREASVAELERWAATYRHIADGLEALAVMRCAAEGKEAIVRKTKKRRAVG